MRKALTGIKTYYLGSLFIFFAATSGVLYFYYFSGIHSEENFSQKQEANLWLDEINKSKTLSEIETYVEKDQVRNGIRELEEFRLKTERIEKTYGLLEEDKTFSSDYQLAYKDLLKLVSYPESSSLLKVFQSKLSQYLSFVEKNNWMTLTRLTKRLLTNLSTYNDFSYKYLRNLDGTLRAEFSKMESVTHNSILPTADKMRIQNRIDDLRVETRMLSRYLVDLKTFKGSFKQLETSFSHWMSIYLPKAALSKIELQKHYQFFEKILLALCILPLLLMIFGFSLNRIFNRRIERQFEAEYLTLTNSHLLNEGKSKLNGSFGSEVSRLQKYIEKRMALGQIFQDALPFPSFLLDENLSIAWGNSLFLEKWGLNLTEIQERNLSWDYIKLSTNLGENDPVQEALKNNLAGIYNIQIKKGEKVLPFEMYIHPLEFKSKRQIMIFLYPLSSMEDALSQQTTALAGPMVKGLKMLKAGSYYEGGFQDELLKDFEIVGTPEVFDAFQDLFETYTRQKESMLMQTQILESKLSDRLKMTNDILNELESYKSNNDGLIDNFKQFNKIVIDSSQNRRKILTGQDKVMTDMNKSLIANDDLIQTSSVYYQTTQDISRQTNELVKIRESLKHFMKESNNYKMDLLESINRSLVLAKNKKQGQAGLEKQLVETKNKVKNLEELYRNINRHISLTEGLLSKIEMILKPAIENHSFSKTDSSQSHDVLREKLAISLHEYRQNMTDGERCEDSMVARLEHLYSNVKQSNSIIRSIVEIIDDYSGESIEAPAELLSQNNTSEDELRH